MGARWVADTCMAVCSVTCALFGSLWLDFAAAEGGAVSDLFAFLLGRRSTHCVWTIAAGVHPPAGRDKEEHRVCAGQMCTNKARGRSESIFMVV